MHQSKIFSISCCLGDLGQDLPTSNSQVTATALFVTRTKPCYLNFLHLEDNSRICVSHLRQRSGTIPLSSRVPIRLHFPRHRPNLSNPNSLTVSLKSSVGEEEFKEAPAKLKGYVMVMLQQETPGHQESLLSFEFETF